MEFIQGGERKTALKIILGFLAEIYSAVSDGCRGIRAIRFLNGDDDSTADNIIKKDDIDKVVDNHIFDGLICVGAGLVRRVLKPFVFTGDPPVKGTPRNMRHMERPLLIMIIIDGMVSIPTFTYSLVLSHGYGYAVRGGES